METQTFKVIIAGSRNFSDYNLLCKKCEFMLSHLLSTSVQVEIVSGTAAGADRLGERYAREKGLPIKLFPADWEAYGKSAGYRRNEEMAKYADALIAFWDGKSKGTGHMIQLAKTHDLKIGIFMVNNQ